MPGNKCNRNSAIPTTRVERLLRQRELRKINRSSRPNEESGDVNRECEILEHELSLKEDNNWGSPNEEEFLDATAAARAFREGCGRQNIRPPKQRLLVVANRLPVSAVRKDEDSWSLEISAGGLVSALLGVKDFEAKWIGWAGVNVPDEVGQRALTKALAEKV